MNIVDSKWVFRIKKNATGEINKYKARLIVCRFTQVHGVDYYDTYTPVAHLSSLCLLLIIAVHYDWDVDVFDFHSVFLNGQLNENEMIYMELLPRPR